METAKVVLYTFLLLEGYVRRCVMPLGHVPKSRQAPSPGVCQGQTTAAQGEKWCKLPNLIARCKQKDKGQTEWTQKAKAGAKVK